MTVQRNHEEVQVEFRARLLTGSLTKQQFSVRLSTEQRRQGAIFMSYILMVLYIEGNIGVDLLRAAEAFQSSFH